MQMAKKHLSLDLPIQLALTILQLCKLRMLKLCYSYLDYYIHRSDFQLVEWDTDAFYLAQSGPTIESVIKPTKRAEHNRLLFGECNDKEIKADEHNRLLYGECNDKEIKADDKHYVIRQCCQKHSTGDCLVLGLFKKEWEGKELLALNSKMYIGTTPYHEKAHQLKRHRHMLYRKLIARALKGWLGPFLSRIMNIDEK